MSGLIHTGLGSSSLIALVLHSPPPPPANSFVIGPAVINTHTSFDTTHTSDGVGQPHDMGQVGSGPLSRPALGCLLRPVQRGPEPTTCRSCRAMCSVVSAAWTSTVAIIPTQSNSQYHEPPPNARPHYACPTNNAKRAKHSKILKPGCFFVFAPFYELAYSVLC